MNIYGRDMNILYSIVYVQSGITFLFLTELLLMAYTYGISHAWKARYHLRLELLIQVINLYVVAKFSLSNKLDNELKILEITVIGKEG
jgi:hypothetical protein